VGAVVGHDRAGKPSVGPLPAATAEGYDCLSLNPLDVARAAITSATSAATLDELVDLSAALCDRAADIGALVHLEFIPMTVIADIATPWRIVRDADRPNGVGRTKESSQMSPAGPP
jgi:hypothetical protein